jgi:hypothetical protein
MNPNWHDLIHQFISGTLSDAEAAALEQQLNADAALRDCYLDAVALDSALAMTAQSAEATLDLPVSASMKALAASTMRRRLQWRPLFAAAAGIVFGMFCTSVVFAYVKPSFEKTTPLLKGGFESGDAPLVTGVPMMAGYWSGDFTEVVEDQQGVKPEEGKKMLRFLRIDSEGKATQEGDRHTDFYRLVDMRPYRDDFADGGAVVQFSAGFNAFAFPDGDTYFCNMSLHAYDSQTESDGLVRANDRLKADDLAAARAGRMKLDRDPATWQRMTGDLRLPPNVNFLMLHITIHHKRGPSPGDTFGGHYLDDVRLTMTRRPPPL